MKRRIRYDFRGNRGCWFRIRCQKLALNRNFEKNQAETTFLKLKTRFEALFSGLPAIAGGYEPETLTECSSNLPEHRSDPPLSAKKIFAWLRDHFVAKNGVNRRFQIFQIAIWDIFNEKSLENFTKVVCSLFVTFLFTINMILIVKIAVYPIFCLKAV